MPTFSHVCRSLSAAAAAVGFVMSSSTGWTATESVCPAPRPTCVLPPARLAEPPSGYFHHGNSTVAAFTVEANCGDPMATCVQPPARIIQAAYTPLASPTSALSLTELLEDWATASRKQSPLTLTEKHWIARRHEPWLSAVALESVVRLTSAVDAEELRRDYRWTLDSRADAVTLNAVPLDDAQKLFCPQLRIELDPITHAVATIDVADRTGTWRPIDLPWAVLPESHRGVFSIVASDSELPPSPSNLPKLRFASHQLEVDSPIVR